MLRLHPYLCFWFLRKMFPFGCAVFKVRQGLRSSGSGRCLRHRPGSTPGSLRILLRRMLTTCPENRTSESPHLATSPFGLFFALSLEQVLGRLVSPSSNPYGPSTDDLSPGCLPGALLLPNGTLLLEVGFTLRCLQRLSHPHFASQLCRWHDNCCTSDASTPVLSY